MKIGVCTGLDNLEKAAAYGFDYIEIGVGSVSAEAMTEEAFQKVLVRCEKAPIHPETANGMLPGTFRITGPEADHAPIYDYLSVAFPRLAAMGCHTVVFGSGGARRVPEGFSHEEATGQIVTFAKGLGKLAAENDITVVIEPLCRAECNIINSVTEGGQIAEATAHPNICLLADYYHIGKDGESMEGVLHYGSILRHCHIAHPTVRTVPKEKDGGDYETFFRALHQIGYDYRCSIEGRVDNFDEEMPVASAYLKAVWEATK